jgi:xanthine dehydrogenase YagS FAD-binding subunit
MVPFAYAAAPDLYAALHFAKENHRAMFIAGGTDMLQLLQESVVAPSELIDINALPLTGIEVDYDGLRIGALTRLTDVADNPRIRAEWPLLAQSLAESASPQVRNMATVGGNLLQRTRCLYFRDASLPCNKRTPGSGCPAMDGLNRMNAIFGGSEHCIAVYPGDMAVALVALDAELIVQGPDTQRRIAVAELHRMPGDAPHIETTLAPGEIITAIHVPPNGCAHNSHYLKLRDRASFEWALVSVAVALAMDGGHVQEAHIVAGGVGTKPWRLDHIEDRLLGHRVDEQLAHAAGNAAADGAVPRAGNAFKIPLLQRAVERALLTAGAIA